MEEVEVQGIVRTQEVEVQVMGGVVGTVMEGPFQTELQTLAVVVVVVQAIITLDMVGQVWSLFGTSTTRLHLEQIISPILASHVVRHSAMEPVPRRMAIRYVHNRLLCRVRINDRRDHEADL